MRKITLFILICVCALCAHAETIVLRTGTRVQGTILFQNEEVVIIRNAEGARFQYPKSDVQEILTDDAAVETQQEQTDEDPEIKTAKKASILLEVGVGAAIIPGDGKTGVGYNVDLLVGSHHIGDKHIFVGGGIGYHGMALGDMYNFLPIQAAIRMPFIEAKHAPVFGLGLGYGIALSKKYVGGLYAGVDFGYRYQLNPKTAISLVAFAQFQQARMTVTETPDGKTPTATFTNNAGRSLVNAGVKFALYF